MARQGRSRAGNPPSTAPLPPLPPSESNYTIPGGATVVANQTQFDTAVAGGAAVDIKVLNGSYSRTTPMVPAAPHRIYGESVAGVVLNYGIEFQNKVGYKVKGLTINCPDATHATVSNACIETWPATGTNVNAEITDCIFDGASVVANGIDLGQPGGGIVQRIKATNFINNGVRCSDNQATSTAVITTISDINAAHIFRSTRGFSNGTAESGLWVTHKVTNGVHRVKVRDTGWMGLLIGGALRDTTITDVDVDQIYGTPPGPLPYVGTGIYVEHYNRNVVISNFWIGHEFGDVINGSTHEWDYSTNAALSGSLTLPAATIPCKVQTNTLTQFPASGTIIVGETELQTVTYTAISGNNFTGCSGGTGAFTDGALISTVASGTQGSSDVTMQDGYINCSSVHNTARKGIYLDAGTRRPIIRNVVFIGMDHACIHDRTNTPLATQASESSLTQTGNNFTGKAAGAVDIYYGL